MKKLVYLGAMAILGLSLTMAQNASTPSDSSNSSKSAQTGSAPSDGASNSGTADPTAPTATGKTSRRQHGNNLPDTTVRDQQGSTTSTTGASGQSDSRPSTSTMGTTGRTPGTEKAAPEDKGSANPQSGTSTDQQPNSSSSPTTPTPHLVMNETPAARAVATHSPDPGTCMNPAVVASTSSAARPGCD
jgi:hypothetical protein